MLTKKIKFSIMTTSLAIIFVFGSYTIFDTYKNNLNNNNNGKEVILSKDYPSTSDLNKMITEADVVVIGEYESFDSKWNMARNPNNIMEEDLENYVEGHLYNFNISELIKGTTNSDKIKINHRFAETITLEESDAVIGSNGIIKKEATKVINKEIENRDPLYIEPTLGNKYMIFLKKDKTFENYYGAIEPFEIMFDENNTAKLQTNIKNINEDNLISEIKVGEKTFVVKNEIHETITDTISGKSLEELVQKVKDTE